MTTIMTKTGLTALALVAAVLTTATLTAAEARGFGNQAHQVVHPHVAAFRALPQATRPAPLPVTGTCGDAPCRPTPAPVPTPRKPGPGISSIGIGTKGPVNGDGVGAGTGSAGGGNIINCLDDRDCGIFRQD